MMKLPAHYRIVSIYLVLGIVWIFFSDMAVELIFSNKEDLTFAQNIKGWLFVAITAVLLFDLIRRDINAVKKTNKKLLESYDQTISGWVNVMDLRHKETTDHTQRVTAMAVELAKAIGISDHNQLTNIERGATLHDIGKIGIPDAILIKPDRLEEKEWEQMHRHPQIAHDILSRIEFLRPCMDIPHYHHEKWDGSGYPEGLSGDAIPIAARLFAVIDVWDAIIHSRVYKTAWSEEKALSYMQEQAGWHFDPAIVEVFIDNYDQIKRHAGINEQEKFTPAEKTSLL
jgi:response regulator RpfG family c-di-GMP phosphodiesterase